MANDNTAPYLSGSDLRDQVRQNLYSGQGAFNPTLTRRPAVGPAIKNPAAWAAGTQNADGTSIPNAAAPTLTRNPATGSAWDNFQPGAATGLSLPSAGTVMDSANRAAASSADAAANKAMYGDPASFAAGSKPPVNLRSPTTPVFSPGSPSMLDPMGDRSFAATQPPVVASSPSAVAGATPAPLPPGAPGKLAGAISATLPGATPASTVPSDGSATSFSGRPLGFGKMVNGVPTFSDGSGAGAGVVPRTMSDAQIADLGKNVNTVSAYNFTHPAVGTVSSFTPGVGQLTRALPNNDPNAAANNAEADRVQAMRDAQSDVASILNEDPRSELGIAARNARINLGDIKAARSRYSVGTSPYQEVLSGLLSDAMAPATGANLAAGRAVELARTGLQEQGATQRALLSENAAGQQLDRRMSHYETDPITGRVTFVQGTDANPVTDTSTGKPLTIGIKPQFDSKGLSAVIQSGDASQLSPEARARVGLSTAGQKPDLNTFLSTMRQRGSKMTDDQLKQYYGQTYGS